MANKDKSLVLLSGGMDSVTVLYLANKVHGVAEALSFNYGSKHNQNEIPYAAYHCKKLKIHHTIINLDFIDQLFNSHLLKSGGEIPEGHYEEENMKRTVVPFRNGIMLAIAAGYAESIDISNIVIAAHGGDHAIYPDCREEYMQSMSEAIRLGTYLNVRILRPFISMTKSQIALKGIELGIDYSKTWSCYKGGNIHCGKCGTCVERREAFILAGIEDPTIYESKDPLPSEPLSNREK